jgi:NAD(P)-dependent dehydrogenase (short-subunit alcohol dehydrogenase family)
VNLGTSQGNAEKPGDWTRGSPALDIWARTLQLEDWVTMTGIDRTASTSPNSVFAQFDLSGKVAIVTGATSGIGRIAAATLADAGASVVAASRRADRLEALASEHQRVFPHPCDIEDDKASTELVDEAVRRLGAIDILVNCAGRSEPEPAETESADHFRDTLAVNLVAPFVLSQLAARHMLQQPTGGSIINVASVLALVGLGRIPQASYVASKAGLVGLTRELAAQWARRGIRVNAIAPGWTKTEMTAEMFDTTAGREWIARLTPMGRGADASELSGAVLYLASPASSYVTGAILPVDGGWTAV